MTSQFTIQKYSEKSIVLKGGSSLKDYESKFEELNGKFNPNLQYISKEGKTLSREGFIFPKEKKEELEELIKEIESGNIEKDKNKEEKKFVTIKEFLNVVSRLERLEQLIKITPVVKTKVGKREETKEEKGEEDSDEDDKEPPKSMIHSKKKKIT